MPKNLLGQTLGDRYRFDALLGEGSFAHVYRITDLNRRATLAAKVLRSDIAAEATFSERFRREAEVLARLQHPNIVRFYDLIKLAGVAFILMDYIPGKTLDEILARHAGPIPPHASLDYLTPLAAALHFAHSEGIIHRDLKPANILIHANGALYVTDFGIARVLNTVSELTLGTTIGTPFYMAPEQITGGPVTVATDIYALGILLYRMYTGMVPFRGESGTGTTPATRITYEHVHHTPGSPNQINPALGLALQEVVLRCLEKDPARRYPSVSALYDGLAEAIGAPPVSLEDPTQTGQYQPVAPDMKLPEWSQFIQPVDEPAPSIIEPPMEDEDTGPAVPLLAEEDAEQPEIPDTRRKTEPHLEERLGPRGAARTLLSLGRRPRRSPPTEPHSAPVPAQRPVTAPYPATPPPYVEPRPARNWTGWVLVLGALAVVASMCVAVIYLVGVFGNDTAPANNQPAILPTAETLSPGPLQRGGDRLAFDSGRNGTLDIYIMNLDGTDLQQVTGMSGAERGPAWSPDGQRIAFYGASSQAGNYDIYVINVDGTGLRKLTDTPDVDERYPTWSPDGEQIAFHSNADGDYNIYIINVNGTGLRAVTRNSADDLGPDWSPEGTQIAYHTAVWGEPFEIAIVSLATLEVRRVTTGDDASTFPTWSPDGSQLAYNVISAIDERLNIALIRTDGTGNRQLTTSTERDSFPDWSPDGTHIIYQNGEPGASAILMIPVSGGEPQALTGRQANFLPEWEPVY